MEFSLDRPSIRLGRDLENDIVLQDNQASRQHAEVSQVGGQIFIRDLNSMNGTFVNDERVTEPRPLQPNDRIRIGGKVLVYEVGDAASPSPFESDWEAKLWSDEDESSPSRHQRRILIGGLVAVATLLILVVAMAIGLTSKPSTEATPMAQRMGLTPIPSAVVSFTATTTPSARPTNISVAEATALRPSPTTTLLPTPPEATVPLMTQVPTMVPITLPFPTPLPLSPNQLEELPPIVVQAFPGVSAENLAQVIAERVQTMPRQQTQAIIAALFPNVYPALLPQVVAASLPGLQPQEIEDLLTLLFPGQAVDLSKMDVFDGQLAVGIYDEKRGRHDLYLASASNGESRLVMEQASGPSFAPDGQWLVYCSWASDRVGLRLTKVDGTEDRLLTSVKEHAYPAFSPDGGRISFYHSVDKILHVIRRDSTEWQDIGKGEYPAWSPTGEQIVYQGCVRGGRCGLIVANTDGSNPKQLTIHPGDAAPRWSPNGGQIAFHSDRDGNWEIYVINSDGSWLRRITTHSATDIMPVWSPNGLHIAFRSDREGSGAVWATAGIGGRAIKLLEAGFDPALPESAQMDWVR